MGRIISLLYHPHFFFFLASLPPKSRLTVHTLYILALIHSTCNLYCTVYTSTGYKYKKTRQFTRKKVQLSLQYLLRKRGGGRICHSYNIHCKKVDEISRNFFFIIKVSYSKNNLKSEVCES